MLTTGIEGTYAAAIVARNMMRTFPQIQNGLLVGIRGGIPKLTKALEIRLGDMVVDQPTDKYEGAIQYAKGRVQENEDTTDFTFLL